MTAEAALCTSAAAQADEVASFAGGRPGGQAW